MEEQTAPQTAGTMVENVPMRLKHFPISFFAVILGMSGTTIAFQRAEMILRFPLNISTYLLGLTVLLFLIIGTVYILKFVKFPDDVKKEIAHPVRLSFFPTISISFLLLAIATLSLSPPVSKILWIIGTILHGLFTLYILTTWIHNPKFQIQHFNAAWFIPVVGNILVPVAGSEHGFMEISWFFFSVGLVFWVVLLTILFNRLMFHHPLPERLVPTLFIMIAPPAVGFIAYGKVNHEILDNFGQVLYHFALFSFLLLVFQIRLFSRLQFYLSWWAYSFPIAAITIATMFKLKLMRDICTEAGATCQFLPLHFSFYQSLAYVLLAVLTVVIAILILKTAMAINNKQICVIEE